MKKKYTCIIIFYKEYKIKIRNNLDGDFIIEKKLK